MFTGSAVALVTPFGDQCIDLEALERLIDFHIEAETECILFCGTTGESATLTHDEHKQMVAEGSRLIREKRGTNPYPLSMAGTGSNNTREALELTRAARDDGADCALLITPYYNKPTQKGMLEHFRTIARTVDIPQVIYNIMGRTAINVQVDTMVELSQEKNIIGVKEASGDLVQISETIRRCPDDFMVWSGDDGLTLPIMAIGGKGTISVTANILPKDVRALVHSCLKGDYQEAQRIHHYLSPVNQALFVETNPIPVKSVVNWLGETKETGLPHCGDLRSPMSEIEPSHAAMLRGVLKTYGLPV